MRIQHNMNAIRSCNQLKKNSKSLRNLSSGYQINQAADDAAGLSISEKMRSQIRGLDMAAKNTQDAISLIQVAEGGLEEIQNILQRVRELSVQAANDTNTEEDRSQIELEVQQLLEEVDHISSFTEFNTIPLLDGTFSKELGIIEATPAYYEAEIDFSKLDDGQTITINGTTFEFDKDGSVVSGNTKVDVFGTSSAQGYISAFRTAYANSGLGADYQFFLEELNSGVVKMRLEAEMIKELDKVEVEYGLDPAKVVPELVYGNVTARPGTGTAPSVFAMSAIDLTTITDGTTLSIDGKIFEFSTDDNYYNTGGGVVKVKFTSGVVSIKRALEAAFHGALGSGAGYPSRTIILGISGGTRGSLSINDRTTPPGARLDVSDIHFNLPHTIPQTLKTDHLKQSQSDMGKPPNAMYMQVGASSGQSFAISIEEMSTTVLGLDNLSYGSHEEATGSISIVDNALQLVSKNRASLGAYQNALGHALKVTENTSENLAFAESKIRDTDMAKQTIAFAKENILSQVAQAMLSQSVREAEGIQQLLEQ